MLALALALGAGRDRRADRRHHRRHGLSRVGPQDRARHRAPSRRKDRSGRGERRHPAGATRIVADGRWVTPGLIQTGTTLGIKLLESGGQQQTAEDSVGGEIKAAFNVAEGIDPASLTLPVARLEGITATLAVPAEGLIPGQGVLFDLAGERLEDLLVKSPAVMVVDLSRDGKAAGGGSRAGSLQRFRRGAA